MKFQITIDRDEDGVWIVECPTIPGCITQGNSKTEAIKNIQEAIALCLEVRAEFIQKSFKNLPGLANMAGLARNLSRQAVRVISQFGEESTKVLDWGKAQT